MKTIGLFLRVLCLSGCLIFSTCLLHKYHFININKTWEEAQTYCQTNYKDLATMENATEVNKLFTTVAAAGYNANVWIGISMKLLGNWTNYFASDYLIWKTQPGRNAFFLTTWCGSIEQSGWTWYENCTTKHPFICNHGSQKVFVNISMDYLDAWSYCKENFTDITAIFNSTENQWFTDVLTLVPSEGRVWFGAIAFGYYFWSDLSAVSFRYWDAVPQMFDHTGVMFGAADLQQSGLWSFLSDRSLPFVCYTEDIQTETIKVLRLRLSSPTDVSDSALEANILSQLQKRFVDKGLREVTLKWRKQPDGKIFLKKGNADVLAEQRCLYNIY